MYHHKIRPEAVVKIIHLEEIHRLIQSRSQLITIAIINQPGITIVAVSLRVLQNHIIHRQGQIQKVIVSLQKLHVPIVLQVTLETAEVILLPAGQVVISHILHHQGQPLHLLAQVAEVVPGRQAVVVPDQVEEEDRLLS